MYFLVLIIMLNFTDLWAIIDLTLILIPKRDIYIFRQINSFAIHV